MTGPENKDGLLHVHEHHEELDKVFGPDWARYHELRAQYANDPRALQQIDYHNRSSQYHVMFRKFVEALI